jgi:nitroreductase
MKPVIDTIQKRYSVRNYNGRRIENEKIHQIREYLDSNKKGPLGSDVRFQIVDGSSYNAHELKKLGTYGLIKGARVFIAGTVNRNKYAMEDFGYCMEKNILMVTDLGIGTCWLGGTLNRSAFAAKLNIADNETIAAVSPIGYAESKNTIKGNIATLIMRSKKRKPVNRIFFNDNINNPLNLEECGDFATVLECVRRAPSAGNMQPWRVIKENHRFHFFLHEKVGYNNHRRYEGVRLQNIDMGIAMAHFDLAASELGLSGKLQIVDPTLENGNLQYIASWVPDAIEIKN